MSTENKTKNIKQLGESDGTVVGTEMQRLINNEGACTVKLCEVELLLFFRVIQHPLSL